MKILYHHRIRSKDGQYVHVGELTDALKGLGHEIILIGPKAIEKEKFGSDAGLIAKLKKCLPGFLYELLEFSYSFPACVRLWRAVKRHHPDGIYERYSLLFPAGIWVRRLFRIPFLLEINAPLLDERSRYDGIQLKRLARWSEEYVWRAADLVLPVTRVLAKRVMMSGVPESRIAVIPNGVDRAKFQNQPNREEAKKQLGLEGKLVLGFTGFIREWHRLDRVIDWLATYQGHQSRHLLLTGDGPARSALEQRARDRGVSHAVTITGVVSREHVSRYIAAYDIALQPAVVEYASPLKLFEYLALGCAIVAPSMPNICEVLTDGENALLFDPSDGDSFSDTIERLCEDSSLREHIRQNARRTIEDRQLTWDHNARRVLQFYAKLGALRTTSEIGTEVETCAPK